MFQQECYTLITAFSSIEKDVYGYSDGRPSVPSLVIPTYVDKWDQRPVIYRTNKIASYLRGGVDLGCYDVSTRGDETLLSTTVLIKDYKGNHLCQR
jgi:hypothetical protein